MARQASNMKNLILASGSPRRRALLENYGFRITVIKPDFDESTVTVKNPEALVTELARGKNRCVRQKYKDALILSADTVVSINGKILGKPENTAQAHEMLNMLSGNTHTVFTGVCISAGDAECVFCEKTDVRFYKLSEAQISRYIESGSPFDKAGGYGIQDDMGIGFIESVYGELSNVIGLPMGRTVREIQKLQGDRK